MTKQGYVYLLQADKWYKIGFTYYLDSRMKQLGTQPPFDTHLLHIIKVDGIEAERELHERYDQYRVQGEWFELPYPAVLDIIDFEFYWRDWQPSGFLRVMTHGHLPAYSLGKIAASDYKTLDDNLFMRGTRCYHSWLKGYRHWWSGWGTDEDWEAARQLSHWPSIARTLTASGVGVSPAESGEGVYLYWPEVKCYF